MWSCGAEFVTDSSRRFWIQSGLSTPFHSTIVNGHFLFSDQRISLYLSFKYRFESSTLKAEGTLWERNNSSICSRIVPAMLMESLRRWLCLGFALFSTHRNGFCQSLATWNTMREGGLQQKLKQLTKNNAMIILDGDNIRGKTRFKLSKEGKNLENKQNVSIPFPTVLYCIWW